MLESKCRILGLIYGQYFGSALKSVLEAVGSKRSPMVVSSFLSEVNKFLGLPESTLSGFARYEAVMRNSFRQKAVQQDDGKIPEDRIFDYYVPCPIAHPTICATKHAHIVRTLRKVAQRIRWYSESKVVGTYYTFFYHFSDGRTDSSHVQLGHYRGSGPKVTIFIECTCEEGIFRRVQFNGEWKHVMDITHVSQFFFKAGSAGLSLDRVAVVTRARNLELASLSGNCYHALDSNLAHAVEVHPSFSASKKSAHAVKTPFDKGLAACKPPKSAKRRRVTCIRMALPKVSGCHSDVDAHDSDYSYLSSGPGSGRDEDSQEEDETRRSALPRQRDLGKAWGPFTVAKTYKTTHNVKTHVGWGCFCDMHCDTPKTGRCKKGLSGTSDHVHRMICHWLILGHDVPVGGNSKEAHLSICPRSYATPSWGELVTMRVHLFGS